MFSGYAPLSVRLVELVDKPAGVGWQNNEDVSPRSCSRKGSWSGGKERGRGTGEREGEGSNRILQHVHVHSHMCLYMYLSSSNNDTCDCDSLCYSLLVCTHVHTHNVHVHCVYMFSCVLLQLLRLFPGPTVIRNQPVAKGYEKRSEWKDYNYQVNSLSSSLALLFFSL